MVVMVSGYRRRRDTDQVQQYRAGTATTRGASSCFAASIRNEIATPKHARTPQLDTRATTNAPSTIRHPLSTLPVGRGAARPGLPRRARWRRPVNGPGHGPSSGRHGPRSKGSYPPHWTLHTGAVHVAIE